MSKPYRTFLILVVLVLMIQPPRYLHAQAGDALLDVRPGPPASVFIHLTAAFSKNLSFRRSIAGIGDLQRRVSNVRLSTMSGGAVSFRELQPGEYLAESEFSVVTYTVDLTPLKNRQAAAHISWMKDGIGVLMLADILPDLPKRADPHAAVKFTVASHEATPVRTAEMNPAAASYETVDPENAVFLLGAAWRSAKIWRSPDAPRLNLSGSWHFTDDEATGFASQITQHYQELFRRPIKSEVQIAIARFPVQTEPGAWQAETRGRTVTIISSDMPFRTQSLQRLHEQLRHELFHLWIPNDLNLTGNYDWFYEGFALYQSLKLAVGMNRIRFEDFLDTLSRAHTIDSAYTQRPSLIEASKNRFAGTNTQVYARGMLIAFLTDVALIENSKTSTDDLLRKLYQQYRKPDAPDEEHRGAVDGNHAVTSLMLANPALEPIVRRYVAGTETINWKAELAAAGIEDIDAGPITTLRVKEKLGGRQKAILDKLGYNNWRKLPRSPK